MLVNIRVLHFWDSQIVTKIDKDKRPKRVNKAGFRYRR